MTRWVLAVVCGLGVGLMSAHADEKRELLFSDKAFEKGFKVAAKEESKQ